MRLLYPRFAPRLVVVVIVVAVAVVVVVVDVCVVVAHIVRVGRRLVHDEGRDDVHPDAHACEEYKQHGDETHGRRINAEVLGKAAADAADLFVGVGLVKFFHCCFSFIRLFCFPDFSQGLVPVDDVILPKQDESVFEEKLKFD